MKCKEIRKSLVEIVDAPVGSGRYSECMKHMQSCDRCRRMIKQFARTWNEWDPAQSIDQPPDLYNGIIRKLDRRTDLISILTESAKNWQRILQPVLAALLLAAGIRFGAFLGTTESAQYAAGSSTRTVTDDYYAVFNILPSSPIADFYYGAAQNPEEEPQ
ncbi:MAG: hypothetical protein GF350_10305 [Chitinivibrionales bacterium]|nr:hypothetical protein [Chitinivibrionales bacterium]